MPIAQSASNNLRERSPSDAQVLEPSASKILRKKPTTATAHQRCRSTQRCQDATPKSPHRRNSFSHQRAPQVTTSWRSGITHENRKFLQACKSLRASKHLRRSTHTSRVLRNEITASRSIVAVPRHRVDGRSRTIVAFRRQAADATSPRRHAGLVRQVAGVVIKTVPLLAERLFHLIWRKHRHAEIRDVNVGWIPCRLKFVLRLVKDGENSRHTHGVSQSAWSLLGRHLFHRSQCQKNRTVDWKDALMNDGDRDVELRSCDGLELKDSRSSSY